jgi:predicted permease
MLGAIRRAIAALFGRSRHERDMADELAFHVERRAEDLTSRGLPVEQAKRRARLEFGAAEAHKEACREARGLRLVHDLRADLVYALRVLRHTPGFALVAILSIALGVGVNTLAFSVVSALVLRPLPVDRPDELSFLEGASGGSALSFPAYRDLRDRNTTFAGLIGYRISPMNLDDAQGASRVWGYLATGNYFDVLGVRPVIGRVFHPEDDRRPGASPFAVLSYECWVARFGADTRVVGTGIHINGKPFTVLGVAPRGFRGTELFYRPEVWVPMSMQAEIEVGNPWLEARGTWNTWTVGRLRGGVSRAQAEANLNAIAADLARTYPATDEGLSLQLARPGLVGDALRTPVKAFTTGVLALAGLVLLAACVNLAAVLVARGADRQREIAIRLSIGAGQRRLVRQLLTEALVLSLAGGVAGAALAWTGSRLLSAVSLPVELPVQFDVGADWRVWLFAFAISLVAGVLFGVAPARQATRMDPNTALKGSDLGSRPGRRWAFRDVLVALQVALCFVLVSASLLAIRGLQQALVMPIGLEPRGVSMVGFELGLAGYDRAQGQALQRRALDAVRQLPGVSAAAYASSLPLNIDVSRTGVYPEDQPALKASEAKGVVRYKVSPDFFRTLGTRIHAGRDFDWHDDSGSKRVAIVNETFTRTVLRSDHPIGRRFRYLFGGDPIEVVGVVEDGKYVSLTETPRAVVFDPILQLPSTETVLLVRSGVPAAQMVVAMRRELGRLDPTLPLYETESLEEMLAFVLFPSRAAAIALGVFGLLAVTLAATGLHGVVAYAVAKRERELGIRMAIGAGPGAVLRLVLVRTGVLLGIGAAVGLLLALLAGQVFATIVYEASPRDPLVLSGVGVGMVVLGVLSCWMPARRALRVSPIIALRAQ